MNPTDDCPVCGNVNTEAMLSRQDLPAMQNYLYHDPGQSRNALRGEFELRLCAHCGFAWNSRFDGALVSYDPNYDNSVPSAFMDAHYREIAEHLNRLYGVDHGLIVDVGCGKAKFLTVATSLFDNGRGLGIDPSLQHEGIAANGRLTLIRDFFSSSHISEPPTVVVCRHVLEHIPRPLQFLQSIRSALRAFPETPVFVEVPDTRWIVERGAYWDFCYEHCNYFFPASLSRLMSLAGMQPTRIRNAFGGQYLCADAGPQQAAHFLDDGQAITDFRQGLLDYAHREAESMRISRERLQARKSEGYGIAIWGMSTKGVLFSYLIDRDRTLFDRCVDVNEKKHGCYVPVSGHPISAPESLKDQAGNRWVIVVMNPNYLDEIRARCAVMAIFADFVDAAGKRFN